jgi:hypothetical protein
VAVAAQIRLSGEQFESMAIELATQPMALVAIKNKLARNRLTPPMFNAELCTRHIKSAYATILERRGNGLLPDHIHVAQQASSPDVFGPGMQKLAEPEGFEPSIGLYNPITV